MSDCPCGNPEGTNEECERCRLIAEISVLKEEVARLRYFYRCTKRLCVDCGKYRGNGTSHWCNACLSRMVVDSN